jgi:hypothetical protein
MHMAAPTCWSGTGACDTRYLPYKARTVVRAVIVD